MSIDSFIYDGDGRSLSDWLRAKRVRGLRTDRGDMHVSRRSTFIGILIDWLYDIPFDLKTHVYSELPTRFVSESICWRL